MECNHFKLGYPQTMECYHFKLEYPLGKLSLVQLDNIWQFGCQCSRKNIYQNYVDAPCAYATIKRQINIFWDI